MLTTEIARKHIAALGRTGSIIDLGCGDGRHSLPLVAHGFRVVSVDISPEAIGRLTKGQDPTRVTGIVADLSEFSIGSSVYDIVMSVASLQFLPPGRNFKLLSEAMRQTKDGGLHIIVALTVDNPDKQVGTLIEREQLRVHYSDWDILFFEEYLTPMESHDGLPAHQHGVSALIARKPSLAKPVD